MLGIAAHSVSIQVFCRPTAHFRASGKPEVPRLAPGTAWTRATLCRVSPLKRSTRHSSGPTAVELATRIALCAVTATCRQHRYSLEVLGSPL